MRTAWVMGSTFERDVQALPPSADRILVLEQGEIAESGTHAELLARRGHYWRMVSQVDRD